MIEVCPACFRFFQSLGDKKKMKEIVLIAEGEDKVCKSMYHKKLTDRNSLR